MTSVDADLMKGRQF